ncbi:MAG: PepSY domain-containing protein [Dethiobacteria bacterium]|jgi:uncharacterized membrane protein YkoI
MKLTDALLKQHLKKAVEDETPDMLEKIFLRVEKEKGAVTMTDYNVDCPANSTLALPMLQGKKKEATAWFKWAASVACLFVFVFGTYLGYIHFSPESIIRFDVNPAVELKINRFEKVLSALPLNKEAKVILDDMNLKNTDLNVAVNALIGSMVKKGYISEIKNSILISVDSNNKQKEIQLQEQLLNEVDALLAAHSVKGAVLSQTVDKDSRLLELAQKHNLSPGKAALINVLVNQDPALDFASLAPLSVNDINLLIASRQLELKGIETCGQANSTAYIGEDAAKQAVLTHAQVQETTAVFTEVKLDYEEGKMVYEIEFLSGNMEYDYEIDAVTGVILKFEHETKKHNRQNQTDHEKQNDCKIQAGSNTYISETQAKQAALDYAKITEKTAEFKKLKRDYEDGKTVYEIEFWVDNIRYEFEIDAVTGEIVEFELKTITVSQMTPASGNTGNSNKGTGEYIGNKKAESIALENAGLSKDSVRKMETELKKKKTRTVYEVEFKYNGYEHEYKIDAYTGEILSQGVEKD